MASDLKTSGPGGYTPPPGLLGGKQPPGHAVKHAKAAVRTAVAPSGHTQARHTAQAAVQKSLAPATPIVTEHTRGQAHPSTTPANRHGLPADYGVTPHPAMSPGDVKHFQQESVASAYEPLTSVVGRGLGNIAQDAFYAPAGVYQAGKGVYHDTGAALHGDLAFEHSRRLAAAMAKQFVESLAHPDRRPGDTALNVLGAAGAVAGTAARVGAATDALRTGEGAAALTRPAAEGGSLLHRPVPKPRTFKVGEADTHLLPSGNPAFRAVQAIHDHIVQNAIENNPEGRVAAYGNRRVGNALAETRRRTEMMQATPAQMLTKTGRKLDKVEQAALRLTAENATPAERIALHEKQAAAGVNVARQAAQIKLLRAVESRGLLIRDAHGNVVVDAGKHPYLAAVDERLAGAGADASRIVADTGQMTPEGIAAREDRPNAVTASGQPVTEDMLKHGARGQLDMLAPETRPGRQYVPYFGTEQKGGLTGTGHGSRTVTGKAKAPISPTKHMTGEALLQGAVPDNTTGLVARALRRQIRYASTDTFRRSITRAGSDARRSSRDVLVNTQELKNAKVPEAIQTELGNRAATLDELQHHATAFETWRQNIIGGPAEYARATVGTPAPPGYKWVDRGLLGDLAKPGPMPAGKIAKTFDTVNAAQTAATVYFKPGHISTRFVTNAVTNIVQGSATPAGIGRSVGLWRQLSHEDRLDALAAAGQAASHAMPAEGENLVGRVARFGSHLWAKGADQRFRFNSLAYEARKEGVRTPAEFRQMLTDLKQPETLTPARRAQVDKIAKNANREAIAYDRLNTFEKTYLRRVIWFYPWIKGSTIFAGRTILEHPVKSAVAANLGQVGQKRAGYDLGIVPHYAEGVFKVGGTSALPLTSNPATLSPLSTPGEVVNALLATAHGHVGEAANIGGMLTPALRIEEAVRTHRDPTSGTELKGNALQVALGQLGSLTPEVTLHRRLTQDKTGKMYPLTTGQSLMQILVGAESPKTTNRAALNAKGLAEQYALKSKRDAAVQRVADTWEQNRVTLGQKAWQPVVTEAIHAESVRKAALTGFPRTAQGRLAADLAAAVTLGKITQAQADGLKAKLAAVPDSVINGKIRPAFTAAWFGGALLGPLQAAADRKAGK